mmetsp:Transcript_15081/g.22816  ORF Transcript_15081/g.22816 Transcript_15081/m.22816 type:complete len:328 (+) Transcript_15081:2485-3468(+)
MALRWTKTMHFRVVLSILVFSNAKLFTEATLYTRGSKCTKGAKCVSNLGTRIGHRLLRRINNRLPFSSIQKLSNGVQREAFTCAEAGSQEVVRPKGLTPLIETQAISVDDLNKVSDGTGIYAILDESETIRYIGLTKKIATTITLHIRDQPQKTKFIKAAELGSDSALEDLQNAWRIWVQESIEILGSVPDGNMKGNKEWTIKKAPSKPELKLTPGKGLEDLNVDMTSLLKTVVKDHKVVAFIKGTRLEPACGFSYSIVNDLSRVSHDFEVVNVLDELHNPGVRDAIKELSDWPTIPQLYVNGEFVGGSDIVTEMASNGELRDLMLK